MFFKRVIAFGILSIALIAVLSFVPTGSKVGADVYFYNQFVSDFSEAEIRNIVEKKLAEYANQTIKIGSKELKPADLGIEYMVEKTVNKLLKQKGTLLASLIKADFSQSEEVDGEIVVPVVDYSYGKLRMNVATILDEYERNPVDAEVEWSERGYYVKESALGRVIEDKEKLIEDIVKKLSEDIDNFKEEKTYKVKYKAISPKVKTEQAEVVLEALNEFSANPVKVKIAGELREIDMLSNQNWFYFDYENGTVSIVGSAIKKYVSDLAKDFNEEASLVTVKDIKGYMSEYYDNNTYYKAEVDGIMESGKTLNEAKLVDDIIEAFNSDEKVVGVEFEVAPMTVVSEVAGAQFDTRLSVGKSSYALGNGANRVHNIKTAVNYQNGTVIPPGGRFSFNDVGGWVTYGKGYVDGKVIMGSGVVDAPGGGVCQVSTTSFRAAVNAGLDIDKRKNHSWDVSYYQDVHGVDAAVYPPAKVDLAYINNTPGYILIHAFVNEPEETVYFEFYGQDDGRSVELSEPWLSRPYGGKTVKTDWTIKKADGTVDVKVIVSSYWR